MDYVSVALVANFTTFIVTNALFGLLLLQSARQVWKRYLLIGVLGQLCWSSVQLATFYFEISTLAIIHIELLRLILWLFCLFLLLSKRTPFRTWPLKAKLLASSATVIGVFGFLFAANSESTADSIRVILMLLAISSLVFTEQVVRNLNVHRMMKLLALCLTFLFSFDIFMYGQSLISHSVDTFMVQARMALAFAIAAALAVGSIIFNEKQDSQYLFTVSRPAVFFSTTAFFSLLLMIVVWVGSLYLQYNGFLGTYIFALSLVTILILLFALVISRAFRQHFEVFVNKHFFTLKYDYRIEWLSATRRISELQSSSVNYYSEVLNILKQAVRADSGNLWINTGAEFRRIAGSAELSDAPEAIPVNEPFIRTMLKESWIFVPHSRETSLTENNRDLPKWVITNTNIWLIVPLIIQMKIVGFAVLSHPKINSDITFEDRDLMTNISTQVASHLLLHQQEKVISDAKQLETYNRLSAFIMHDINNVIAQLALLSKNAERHRHNPAFVDDMIKTVENATIRMQGLIQKFNPASKEKRTEFQVSKLLQNLSIEVEGYLPKPTLTIIDDFTIHADIHRLTLAIKNLVRNAQEATKEDGELTLIAEQKHGERKLIVQDNGSGMSERFINEHLFRPFTTTKEQNGVGIGTYLTKSYLEHLGATLSVNSQEGVGTRFEIKFSM